MPAIAAACAGALLHDRTSADVARCGAAQRPALVPDARDLP